MAACLVVVTVGIGRAKTETSFLNNFRRDSPLVQAYNDVELHFGGTGFWDVVLNAPVQFTDEYLSEVRDLENQLRAIEVDGARLTKVLSLADAEEVVGSALASFYFRARDGQYPDLSDRDDLWKLLLEVVGKELERRGNHLGNRARR